MNNIIGNILQELLKKKGAPTKRDFAEILGISPKTLYNILDGSSELTLSQLTKASDILSFNIVAEYFERFPAATNNVSEPKKLDFTPQDQSMTLTINFTVPPSAMNNIGTFLTEVKTSAIKRGIKIV